MRAKSTGKKLPQFAGSIGIGAIALIVVSVAAVAMLFGSRPPSQAAPGAPPPVEEATAAAQPAPVTKNAPAAKSVPAVKSVPAAKTVPAAKSVTTAKSVAAAKSVAPPQSQTSKALVPITHTASVPAKLLTSTASTSVPTSTAITQEGTVATITGCLDRSDQAFRLKDTAGVNAPKSRSWKSGFLKKRSADVAVFDDANRLHLSNYIGQRVTLTGTLTEREMQARSLVPVSRSCN